MKQLTNKEKIKIKSMCLTLFITISWGVSVIVLFPEWLGNIPKPHPDTTIEQFDKYAMGLMIFSVSGIIGILLMLQRANIFIQKRLGWIITKNDNGD